MTRRRFGVDAFTRLAKLSGVGAIISMKAADALRAITDIGQRRGSKICVWLNLKGRWNYAVAGRTDPSEDFSSKEEAIRAMHAKIAELEHQNATIKTPWLH